MKSLIAIIFSICLVNTGYANPIKPSKSKIDGSNVKVPSKLSGKKQKQKIAEELIKKIPWLPDWPPRSFGLSLDPIFGIAYDRQSTETTHSANITSELCHATMNTEAVY